MFKVKNGYGYPYKVLLTQGDSAVLKLGLKDADGNEVKLEEGDTAVLSVKRNLCCGDIALQLEISEGQFNFTPADTAGMPTGEYWFDVEVRMAGGDIYTVIAPSKFVLLEGVS